SCVLRLTALTLVTTSLTFLVSYITVLYSFLFFFNAPATSEIYTLSLHDALPISLVNPSYRERELRYQLENSNAVMLVSDGPLLRSEEHTSELQSRGHLVCRLLLEKKKKKKI